MTRITELLRRIALAFACLGLTGCGPAIPAAAGLTCMALSGCTSITGRDSKDWQASAYTLSGCQTKLDNEAGQHVEMTGHSQRIIVSVFNFGIEPAYYCWGPVQQMANKVGASTADGLTPPTSVQLPQDSQMSPKARD
jgi:hypothetical protein